MLFSSPAGCGKRLKAFLYLRGKRGFVTHSVYELASEAVKLEKSFKIVVGEAAYLDKHYIPPRYPDSFPAGSPKDYYDDGEAKRCIQKAGLMLARVRQFMKG